MRNLDDICKRHGILLIVDDIQVGNGRTGPYFSFEEMGIDPDIVTLSKSISGSGLPMALVLMKPEHDVWAPGEHNGTFRGNNAAFVTATAALEHFWSDDELTTSTLAKSERARAGLESIMANHPGLFTDVRGRGLILGMEAVSPEIASMMAKGAFERGLIIETAGAEDEVVKLLPPLVVTDEAIDRAIDILGEVADGFDQALVDDLRAQKKVSS
jgi:diaminobutyrate-2-oxoglutarate transaminase